MQGINPALKLYIWADPYGVFYGTSMAFAIAPDVETARAILRSDAVNYAYADRAHGVGSGVDLGEPTRVLDVPCGEWHEWSE